MLTFNLKKQWFDKIKSGEKTHEYREIKPYWTKRLIEKNHLFYPCNYAYFVILQNKNIIDEPLNIECVFVCGYAKKTEKGKRINAKIKSIRLANGLYTDLKTNKTVYDIEFELIREV